MPIDKKPVQSVFAAGIDSSADPKLTSQGLLRLTNGVVDYKGAIEKREGLTTLSGTYSDTQMTSYEDRPILLGDSLSVFNGTTATAGSFVANGTLGGFDTEITLRSADGVYTNTGEDCALINNDTIFVIIQRGRESGTTNFYYWVKTYNVATGEQISSYEIDQSTTHQVKLLKAGSTLYLLYSDDFNGLFKYNTIPNDGDVSGLTATMSTLSGVTGVSSDTPWDACVMADDGSAIGIVHSASATTVEFVGWVLPSTVTKDTLTVTGEVTQTSCAKMTDGTAIMAYSRVASDVYYVEAIGYDEDATTTVSSDEIYSEDDILITDIAMHPTSATQMAVYLTRYTDDASVDANRRGILKGTFTNTAGTGAGALTVPPTAAYWQLGCGLATKPFVDSSGNYYLCLFYERPYDSGSEATTQDGHSTFVIVNTDGDVVSRFMYQYAFIEEHNDVNGTPFRLREMYHAGSDVWYMGCGRQVESKDVSGMASVKITQDIPDIHAVESEDYLHIPGSCPMYWDGDNLYEQGFIPSPGLSRATATTNGSGGLTEGQYGYIVVYEWLDKKGKRNRSAPSAVTSVAVSATEDAVKLYVKPISLTNRFADGDRSESNVAIVIYRTLVDGNQYHRLDTEQNALTLRTILYNDTASDASISSNEYIYTNGDVLGNQAPPPYWVSCTHQNRLFVVNDEDKTQDIWYSKEFEAVSGVSFSPFLTLRCGDEGGEIKALASFSDRLVIFKKNKIFATHGEGLSPAGTGSGYATPYLISEAIGCVNQKTVVRTPDGIMFESEDGIYLLTKSFETVPIGDKIKYQYEQVTLKKADIVPDKHHVIFLSDGDALVYDYKHQLWSTFTNHEASDGVVVDNRLYIRDDSTSILVQKPGIYRDSGSVYPLTIRTGWFPFAQLGGFMRLYSILLFGQNVSIHKLRVKTAFDFDPVWVDNQTFDSSDIANYLDATSHYGDGKAVGYRDKSYILDVATSQQKCTAVMLEISDETTGGDDPDQAYTMSGISFLVGLKRFQKRMDSTRRF